jgi:hypothetical protein
LQLISHSLGRHHGAPLRIRLRLANVAFTTLLAGCGHNPTRSGPLAGLADSLLPDRGIQTCTIVPADMDLERQGFRECVSGDRAVLLRVEATGRVRRVSQSWASPPQSLRAEIVGALQRGYGPGVAICDPQVREGWRWETPTYRIEVFVTAADNRLELMRELRLAHSFEADCPDTARGAA